VSEIGSLLSTLANLDMNENESDSSPELVSTEEPLNIIES
jgi:hypothetical protein